jgi:type VI protein secretion system component Hcp
LPADEVLAQALLSIGTLSIPGITSSPVAVYSAGLSYKFEGGDAASGGGGAGKVSFSLFTLTKRVDASSPKFLVSAASGETFPNARIELLSADGTLLTAYDLEGIRVLNATVKNALDAGAPALVEDVALSYSLIRQTVPSSSGPVIGCWDNAANQTC